ncbi:MAG: TolC family protein [Desulfobaccales bacterium]
MNECWGKLFLLILLVGSSALAGAALAQEAGGRLTLKEGITIALKQNPSVTEFKERTNVAKEQIGVSRGALLPQVGFSGTAFYGNAFTTNSAQGQGQVASVLPSATSSPNTSPGGASSLISIPFAKNEITTFEVYRFSANQLLFDFGKTPSQVAASKANYKKTTEDYANTRQQVVLNVRNAYFAYLASRRAIKVAEENVRQNQELLKQANAFYNVGVRARVDVTFAESNLANADTELIRARNLAEISKVDLMTALGLKTWPFKDVEDTLEVTPKPLSLEELKAQGLRQRPELKRTFYQQQEDQANITGARANFLPSVQGFAARGFEGSRHELEDQWWIGAGVNVPLFEGLSNVHTLRQARAQLRSTQANTESVTLTVLKEVENGYQNLKSAWEVIKSRIKAREAAAENLRLAAGRYREGVGSIIEVTDAQVRFAQADLDQVRALFDYRVAEARLDKAVGTAF